LSPGSHTRQGTPNPWRELTEDGETTVGAALCALLGGSSGLLGRLRRRPLSPGAVRRGRPNASVQVRAAVVSHSVGLYSHGMVGGNGARTYQSSVSILVFKLIAAAR
jgi:hypothetical protein